MRYLQIQVFPSKIANPKIKTIGIVIMEKQKYEYKMLVDKDLMAFRSAVDGIVRIDSLSTSAENLKLIQLAVCTMLGASIDDIKKEISTIDLIIGAQVAVVCILRIKYILEINKDNPN